MLAFCTGLVPARRGAAKIALLDNEVPFIETVSGPMRSIDTSNSKARFGVQHFQAMAKLEPFILKPLKIHNEHGHQD